MKPSTISESLGKAGFGKKLQIMKSTSLRIEINTAVIKIIKVNTKKTPANLGGCFFFSKSFLKTGIPYGQALD